MEKIKEVLSCLAYMEKETYKLYDDLYSKMEDSKARGTILFISLDTLKHYLIYSRLAGEEQSENPELCSELLGEMYRDVIKLNSELRERISNIERIDEKELEELLECTSSVERKIYEEAMVSSISRILSEESRGEIAKVLMLIGEDELRHDDLLRKLIDEGKK
ncbi:MAG: hypothetical protein QXK13_05290 [Fervidicoccaceae archaeon]